MLPMIQSARTAAAAADAEVPKRKADATEHVPKPPKAPRRTRTMALQLGLESGALPEPNIAGDTTGNTEDDEQLRTSTRCDVRQAVPLLLGCVATSRVLNWKPTVTPPSVLHAAASTSTEQALQLLHAV